MLFILQLLVLVNLELQAKLASKNCQIGAFDICLTRKADFCGNFSLT